MQCAYFTNESGQCKDLAEYPFACCDNVHGYRFKQNKAQIVRYLNGEIEKKHLEDFGVKWTEEKIAYMTKLTKQL